MEEYKGVEYEGYEEHKCNGCFYFKKYEGEEKPNCKYCEYTEGALFFQKWDSIKKCK